MFTSKQRSNLRAIAQGLQPITQIGKGGISDNLIKTLSEALEARELIKISVLDNSEEDAKSLAAQLETALDAQVVGVIGRKITIYRKSSRKDFQHIQY